MDRPPHATHPVGGTVRPSRRVRRDVRLLPSPLRFRREHRWTVRHLSDHLDGDLTAEEHRRLDEHARECLGCGRALTTLAALLAALAELREDDAPRVPTGRRPRP